MPTFDAKMDHGDESGAVPTRSVDDAVHGAERKRGEAPPGAVSLALAEGVSLSGVRRPVVFVNPSQRRDLIPVSGIPASNDPAERHGVRGNRAAVDDLVPRDPPADLDQDQHGRTGIKLHLSMSYRTAWHLKHKGLPPVPHSALKQHGGADEAERRYLDFRGEVSVIIRATSRCESSGTRIS